METEVITGLEGFVTDGTGVAVGFGTVVGFGVSVGAGTDVGVGVSVGTGTDVGVTTGVFVGTGRYFMGSDLQIVTCAIPYLCIISVSTVCCE